MIIVYLKSKDLNDQNESLVNAGVCHVIEDIEPDSDEVKSLVLPLPNYAVDTIGFVEGFDGFLCNLLGDFTDEQLALLPVIPKPQNPLRTFAGW